MDVGPPYRSQRRSHSDGFGLASGGTVRACDRQAGHFRCPMAQAAAHTVAMQSAEAERLFDYVYWMRDVILTAAQQLTDEAFRSTNSVGTRDLRSTLVHELDVESSWRRRLRQANEESSNNDVELNAADFPNLESLASLWRSDEVVMRSWLATLTDADLASPPPDQPDKLPVNDYLLHVVGHAIEEFTESALLLTHAGHSPGGIEFLKYANRRRDPASDR